MAVVIDKALQQKLLRSNTRFSFLDGMWFNIMMGALNPYMGLYVLRLGGTDQMVGWLTSVPPIVSLWAVIVAAPIVERQVRKLPMIVKFNFVSRSMFALMALIPWLPESFRPTALIVGWGAMYIPWAMASAAWTPMISTLIPGRERGRFFGNRNTAGGAVALASTFVVGRVLDQIPFLTAFTGIFLVSFVAVMVSQYYVIKQREPVEAGSGDVPATVSFVGRVRRVFAHPERGKRFALYCGGMLVFHFGLTLAWPLFPVRQVEELGFSNGVIGLLSTAASTAALVGNYFGGRIIHRWGYSRLLLITTLGSVLPPLAWSVFSSPWILGMVSITANFFSAGYFMCQLTMVLDLAPEERLSDYVVINSATANLAGAVGPLVGSSVVAAVGMGTQVGMVLSSAVMIAGVAILGYMLKQQRHAPVAEVDSAAAGADL